MQSLNSTTIRYIFLNSIMENPNMKKQQKVNEVHDILKTSDQDILKRYYNEKVKEKINLEETYSSLFKGSDINENKKNK